MESSTQIQFLSTFGQDGPVGIIDVDTSVQFPINFAVGDVREPFAKKGVKSYKFSIVGSKETNQLLNHYYDINIVDGTFNNNRKQKVAILRNGVIILDNAYMQLLTIKKETNDVYSDQQITYDIEVGDDVTSFFTEITNKYLEDLNFDDMTHTYEAANVVASYPNSAIRDNVLLTGGYKYCLAWTPLTKYVLEECRPAISVYEYFNRIHQTAGYQWEWIGFDSDDIRFDKLWIPYNGDKPMVSDRNINMVAAENSVPLNFSGVPLYDPSITINDFIIDTEIQDLANLYDPVTGLYTSNIYSGSSALDVTFEVTYEFKLNNSSLGTAYLTMPTGPPATIEYMEFVGSCDLRNTSTSFDSVNAVWMDKKLETVVGTPYTLAAGLNTVATGTIQTPTIPYNGAIVGLQLETRIGVAINKSLSTLYFRTAATGGALILVTASLVITDIKMIIVPRADIYGYGIAVNLNDFVPRKIKQSDFIKAIANMYNLVITPDPTNDRKILYSLRDDYYDAGTEKDWTNKLATDKGSEISFISSTNAKKIILSYKADSDIVNKDYLAETKEVYGQQEYALQNDNIKGLENKEILFSPTPIDNTSFGTANPMWAGQSPKCNIRILLDGGEQPTGLGGTQTYDIVNYSVGSTDYGVTGINTYPMLTHQDNPATPMFDINFGLCDKYYHDFTSVTNNNLYSMFWRRTIGQIDKGKLFTAYFYLNEYDISILKLNDKIFIKDTWYNINSLQYDPNSFGPTKVVLMTIDDELAIDVIRAKPTYPILATETLSELSGQIYNDLNWNYADSSVRVMGTGNVVAEGTKNVLVVGNNRIVEDSNTIYTENLILDGVEITDVVQGTGTDNYIPKWNGTTALEDSLLYDYGTGVRVLDDLDVYGDILLSGALQYGLYTPTLTNTTNIVTSTAYQCQWMRQGNTVTVSGKVAIDVLLTATSTVLGMSLPVASNFGNDYECGGTAFCISISGLGAGILADAVNDRATIQYVSTDINNTIFFFTFTYTVI